MSLSTLTAARSDDLDELLDGLAARSGAWVVVERSGRVLAHAAGAGAAPAALVEALLGKHTAPLRAKTTWRRSARPMHGQVQDVTVAAWELDGGDRLWSVGGELDTADVTRVALALNSAEGPPLPRDRMVEQLLHPRGPARGRAPVAGFVRATDRHGHRPAPAPISNRRSA